MKLKYTFETMELDDHIIAVPIGEGAREFRGVVKLNESAAEIFELLKQETTEASVVTLMKRRYGDEREIVGYVHDFINYLANEGVLE